MPRRPPLSRLTRILRLIAWTAVVVSFPLWGAAFLVVPFLPMSGATRAAIAGFCIVFADVIFWVGAFYLGSDVIARFRPPKVTTGKSFAGKRVAVIGATGRLGQAVARAVQREGGTPLLLGRDLERLRALAAPLQLDERLIALVDLRDASSLRAAALALRETGSIDFVVGATGQRAHLALAEHSDTEMARAIELDLMGPMHVARAFLPVVEERAIIALLGGYANGSIVLPYHTLDVAARAGLAGFCAAANRELELEGRLPRLCYTSPAPLEGSEQGVYAAAWNKLGSRSASDESVANFILASLLGRRTVAIMGWRALLLTWLHGAVPPLGHILGLRAVEQVTSEGSSSVEPPAAAEDAGGHPR